MRDLFPDDERAQPEFEGAQQAIPDEVVQALSLLLPDEMFEKLIDKGYDSAQDTLVKISQLCAARGHSAFRGRLGVVPVDGTEGVLLGQLTIILDIDGFKEEGHDIEEIKRAIAQSFDALNQYFESLK